MFMVVVVEREFLEFFFSSSFLCFNLQKNKIDLPHGHGQLLGVDGSGAVRVEEVEGLAICFVFVCC